MEAKELLLHARKAQENAVAKYSDYPVGAALLSKKGEVIKGCNIESKAYPSTMCAERVAIFSAISQSIYKFNALAIITSDGGMPCGACLQIIHEFCGNIPIYVGDENLNYKSYSTHELLPHPFG